MWQSNEISVILDSVGNCFGCRFEQQIELNIVYNLIIKSKNHFEFESGAAKKRWKNEANREAAAQLLKLTFNVNFVWLVPHSFAMCNVLSIRITSHNEMNHPISQYSSKITINSLDAFSSVFVLDHISYSRHPYMEHFAVDWELAAIGADAQVSRCLCCMERRAWVLWTLCFNGLATKFSGSRPKHDYVIEFKIFKIIKMGWNAEYFVGSGCMGQYHFPYKHRHTHKSSVYMNVCIVFAIFMDQSPLATTNRHKIIYNFWRYKRKS